MTYHVSIIVPIYNVSKYIKRCAVSLLGQTYDDIQFIFVNDCTPDDSIEILNSVIDKYPKRKNSILIINHKENKGLGAARNTGLQAAEGNYILNIDSDDYIELNMVEIMFKKALKTNADIVICDYFAQWNKVNKICEQTYSSQKVEYINMLLSGESKSCVWNKMVKKSLYFENQIFPVAGIDMGEDYLMIPRLAYYANTIEKISIPLYHYMQTNDASYTKKLSEKSATSLINAIKKLNSFFECKNDGMLYKEGLRKGKLRKKIILIMSLPSSKRQLILTNLFEETNDIGPELKLPIQDQLALYMANKKPNLLLSIYLVLLNTTIEAVQIIKGRRF